MSTKISKLLRMYQMYTHFFVINSSNVSHVSFILQLRISRLRKGTRLNKWIIAKSMCLPPDHCPLIRADKLSWNISYNMEEILSVLFIFVSPTLVPGTWYAVNKYLLNAWSALKRSLFSSWSLPDCTYVCDVRGSCLRMVIYLSLICS